MPKAIPTDNTAAEPLPPTTRRAALAAIAWTGTAALSGAALGHSLADAAEAMTPSPDATLIRACDDHIALLDAINGHGERPNDDPIWSAYDRASDAIIEARAVTLDGMMAKARAAKRAARLDNGDDYTDGAPADIAWSIVNDLMQLAGGRAA